MMNRFFLVCLAVLFTSSLFAQKNKESKVDFNHFPSKDTLPEAWIKSFDFHEGVFPEPLNRDSVVKSEDQLNFGVFPELEVAAGYAANSYHNAIGHVGGGLHAQLSRKGSFNLQLGFAKYKFQGMNYVMNSVDSLGVYPGFNRVIFKSEGQVLLNQWYGKFEKKLGKYFQFALGQESLHLGEGYRSLILDKHMAPLPYVRFITRVGRFQLTNLWIQAQNDVQAFKQVKYAALHTLSWNVTKKWNVSLYEWVIWQAKQGPVIRSLDLHYLQPFAFLRPIEYAQGSSDNVILGFSSSYTHKGKYKIYMQMVLDEFLLSEVRARTGWWGLKYGGQLGIKLREVVPNVNFNTEINTVMPFTYSHNSPDQCWGNKNSPLGAPLGSNFIEWCSQVNYSKPKYEVSLKCNYAAVGHNNSIGNYGGNVFVSYNNPVSIYGNKLLQGTKQNNLFTQVEYAWKWSAFQIFTTHCFMQRKEKSHTQNEYGFWIGIRMGMPSLRVWDF